MSIEEVLLTNKIYETESLTKMKEHNALCKYIVNSLYTVYAIDERKQISDEEETATDPIYIMEKKIQPKAFFRIQLYWYHSKECSTVFCDEFSIENNNCANTKPLNV